MNAENRTAIVTGATSGIGFAIARKLLASSWNVVGNGRSQERLDEAAIALEAPRRFFGVAGDVSSPETAKRLVSSTVERFGHVDLLVNNAGIFMVKPFVELTVEDIERQIATNLKGAVYTSQQAGRRMLARGQGQIINITAAVAIKPRSDTTAFLASLLKGGLNEATRALALELAPHGIRVNAIAPGIIDSPMHDPATHGVLKAMQPMDRLGTPDEVADAVLFLADARFVTGIVLPVDGGMSAGNV